MQKVRSHFILYLLELLIKLLFHYPSLTVLYALAYILYLALEEGSPLFSNRFCPFYLFNLSVESILTIFQVMLILFILLQCIYFYILILI